MIDNLRVLLTVVRHPRLARVELGFACFALLEHGGWLAVLVYAFGRGGVSEAGVAALVQLVPAALVAPIAAVAGDRFPRARVLAASHLAQAVAAGVVAVAMFADASPVVVYAAATLLAVTVTFSRPAMGSLLPSVAGSARELTAANVAAGLIENVGRFLGPALAGLIIHLAEPATVFAVAAPMMVGAALLAASVRPESAELLPVVDAERPLRLIGAGFVLIGRQRAPRLVLGVLAALNVVIGALDVMFVGVAVDLLDREESVSGLLSGAAGFGGVLGAVTAVAMVGRRRLTPAIAFGSLLVGGPVIALVGVDGVALAICLLAVSGAGRTVVGIASRSLLQGITPDDVLARVFGVHEGMTMAAYGVGSILVVGLEVWFGLSTTLVVIGLLLPVVVARAGAAGTRRGSARTRSGGVRPGPVEQHLPTAAAVRARAARRHPRAGGAPAGHRPDGPGRSGRRDVPDRRRRGDRAPGWAGGAPLRRRRTRGRDRAPARCPTHRVGACGRGAGGLPAGA